MGEDAILKFTSQVLMLQSGQGRALEKDTDTGK